MDAATRTSGLRTAAVPSTPSDSDLELIHRVDRALEVLRGKWRVHLLFLMARGIRRHGRLLDALPGASKKVMTDTLRALERDGLVTREIFPQVPVRVEYSLTALGWTLTEPLIALADWGAAHADDVAAARSRATGLGYRGDVTPCRRRGAQSPRGGTPTSRVDGTS